MKIPEQHTSKAQHQETTENSHTVHSAHISESTNLKVQNVQHGAITLHAPYIVTTECR
jgi:hypothetical protein